MQAVIVGEPIDGAEPDVTNRRHGSLPEKVRRFHQAKLERTFLLEGAAHNRRQTRDDILQVCLHRVQRLGRRDLRHRQLVIEPLLRGLERGESSPVELRDGWAFCGKPSQAVNNDGSFTPPPAGMVFVVALGIIVILTGLVLIFAQSMRTEALASAKKAVSP